MSPSVCCSDDLSWFPKKKLHNGELVFIQCQYTLVIQCQHTVIFWGFLKIHTIVISALCFFWTTFGTLITVEIYTWDQNPHLASRILRNWTQINIHAKLSVSHNSHSFPQMLYCLKIINSDIIPSLLLLHLNTCLLWPSGSPTTLIWSNTQQITNFDFPSSLLLHFPFLFGVMFRGVQKIFKQVWRLKITQGGGCPRLCGAHNPKLPLFDVANLIHT